MRGGAVLGGYKKCKSIPAPLLLRGQENPHGTKQGEAGQMGLSKIAIPTSLVIMFKTTFLKCQCDFLPKNTKPNRHLV